MIKNMIGLLFMLASIKLFSQQSINFGIIYGQRLNHRASASVFNRVTGISAEYNLPVKTKTDLRLSAGIEGTNPGLVNPLNTDRDNYVVIPVRVGIQPYIYEDKAFIFAESGPTIKTFPVDDGDDGGVNTKVGLSLALGGGYRFSINKRKYIQGSMSYNYIPNSSFYTLSWLNVRIAYGLKWGNNLQLAK